MVSVDGKREKQVRGGSDTPRAGKDKGALSEPRGLLDVSLLSPNSWAQPRAIFLQILQDLEKSSTNQAPFYPSANTHNWKEISERSS